MCWSAILLFFFVGISILVLHFSLRKHLIAPVDEVRHIIDDELNPEDKEEMIEHLPDEVAVLAKSYEKTHDAQMLMEKQFHQAQKMEAIGTLVGGIAHDFNNTLAGINGNLYLARQSAAALPDVIEKLERIEKLSHRSSETVKNLLTFAHKTRLESVPILLGAFIKEAIKLNRVSVPESVELIYDVADDNLVVKGDATQLHQVLLNLINNALHATEANQQRTIHVSVDKFCADALFMQRHHTTLVDFARIAVSDNGHGISKVQIDHIFEPFYTTKAVGKGTGLGLAMVYGSIQSQHGYIEVESEPGEGTTFTVFLPLIENPGKEQQGVIVDSVPGKGESILLADDEEALLTASVEVFESLGYKVFSARDGQQAVELYEQHRNEIRLVLLDIVMPVQSGVMAAKKIREINPNARVVFITGYDNKGSVDSEVVETGDPIVYKPCSIESLSALVREHIGD